MGAAGQAGAQADTLDAPAGRLARIAVHAAPVVVAGVSGDSPLGTLIGAACAGRAVVFAGGSPPPDQRWRRAVAGSGLQWWSDDTRAERGWADAVIVDLGVAGLPVDGAWQIVDGSGAPLLSAWHGLHVCHRPPHTASLFLIAGAPGDRVVLAEAHVSSVVGYARLLGSLARAAAFLVHTACDGAATARPWVAGPAARLPALALARSRLADSLHWVRARFGGDMYAVGLLPGGAGRLLHDGVLAPAEWRALPPAEGFIADPFFWPGRPGVILCEHYTHGSGRGRVATMDLGDPCARPVPLASMNEEHVSYPFTWAEGGRVFCLPEMAAAGRQTLFEIGAGGAAEICVVAETAMADPTLWQEDGLYWIAYADAGAGMYDTLCLLWAERLEGPWQPHACNPIKLDVRSARPAGRPFRAGGQLYRPAQDCSRSYGGAVLINTVLVCNRVAYREQVVATLRPDPFGHYPHGMHTVDVQDGSILIDGKRVSYHPSIVLNKILRRVQPFWRGL